MPRNDPSSLGAVFRSLRAVLERHANALTVSEDTTTKFCLEAPAGPATLQAWGGKVRRARIPVAWVEIGKSYVSYHLMGVAIPAMQSELSGALRTRMQGKTCFNFTVDDETLFAELDRVTGASITAFRSAGFTT